MSEEYTMHTEPMLEMFFFETNQLMEQFEDILISVESNKNLSEECINEIFRIMHTIKGSSSMMIFEEIAGMAHNLEDLFFYIRENNIRDLDCVKMSDIGFMTIDYINGEIAKLQGGENPYKDDAKLKSMISEFLSELVENKEKSVNDNQVDEGMKVHFLEATKKVNEDINPSLERLSIKVVFEDGCQMESMRAFTVVNCLSDITIEMEHYPEELFEDDGASDYISENGFLISFKTNLSREDIYDQVYSQLYVEEVIIKGREDSLSNEEVESIDENPAYEHVDEDLVIDDIEISKVFNKSKKSNIISVNVEKMDKLMDLVGEIVITESMVTKNPDLKGLELENFNKASRQLRKLNDELQDIVMSMRMIPIGPTFHKMHRIVRDMNKNLGKKTELVITGEDTEVDKNIIDSLGDPLMHIIRNSLDHGIEPAEGRLDAGKNEKGSIRLDAVNTGGDVIISISDDGKGLSREAILEKARENNLLLKSETEMTDREIYNLILLPGFSTKKDVTEYSGRGVGMDVVKKNIERNGGTILIDSEEGKGMTISIKIPLTLAIIDGMKISVGDNIFTIPTTSIRESFKAVKEDLVNDTMGNEMVMIRGNCYPIIRLHEKYLLDTEIENIMDGILVMVEADNDSICIFADGLIGEQQVVVKPVPSYLSQYVSKDSGVAGCAILGDGKISLILDILELAGSII